MSRVEITTLLEERATLWEQAQALSNVARTASRDLSGEERTQYDAIMVDFESKSKHVERLQKEEGIAPQMTRSQALTDPAADEERNAAQVGDKAPVTRAGQLWGRIARNGDKEAHEELRDLAKRADLESIKRVAKSGGREGREAKMLYAATDEYRDAFEEGMRRGLAGISLEMRTALSVGTGADGGYLVPTAFMVELVQSERFYGVMRQLARKISTSVDGNLSIPKVDDSNRATAVWLAEAASFTESEDQFLTVTLGSFKQGFVSKVSDELILDSAFDILGFVAQSSAQGLGILANTAYVTGSSGSTTTPEGLFTKATVGFTLPTGNTTAITYNGIVELYHSVRPAYRSRGQFVAADNTIKLLRELVDSQARPLWQPALIAGEPDTLFGAPIYADPDVATPAANALCMGFGDVASAYMIRDVQDVTVKILNELYAANGQVGYRVHRRTDGDIVDTLAFKTLKNSAT